MIVSSLTFTSGYYLLYVLFSILLENYYITVKLDYRNEVSKTELCQNFIIQVYAFKIFIDTLNKGYTGFFMVYDGKGLSHTSCSTILLLLPPELLNMTQYHKTMCDRKNVSRLRHTKSLS